MNDFIHSIKRNQIEKRRKERKYKGRSTKSYEFRVIQKIKGIKRQKKKRKLITNS